MNRGVVVGVKDSHMIVLTEGNFMRVLARPGVSAGEEIQFDLEETNSRKKRSWFKPGAYLAGLAAAVVMFCFLLPMVLPANQDYAVAVVDINPSIELVLNQEGEVSSFSALNDDGAGLGDMGLVGLGVGKALEIIIGEAEKQGFIDYLDETNVLVTTVPLGGNENVGEIVKGTILDDLADSKILKNVNLAIVNLPKEAYQEARDENRPVGLSALPGNQDLQYGTVREYFSNGVHMALFEEEGAFIRSENQSLWHIIDSLERLAIEEKLELDLDEIRNSLRSGSTELSEVRIEAEEMLKKTKENVEEGKEKEEKIKDEKLNDPNPNSEKVKENSDGQIAGQEKASEAKSKIEDNKD